MTFVVGYLYVHIFQCSGSINVISVGPYDQIQDYTVYVTGLVVHCVQIDLERVPLVNCFWIS
jgi:hypothetical protein